MNKLSSLGHWLWMEARLGTSPLVQRLVISHLHKAKELARMAAKPYLTLHQWQGINAGGELTVTYAGLDYVAPTLKSLLFDAKPLERDIGQVPVWRPQSSLNSLDGDINIFEASSYLIRQLPRQNSVILPARLQFTLETQGAWEKIEKRFRRDARRNEVRRAEKLGYEYEISRRHQDLDMFYEKMYVPTIQKRHGDLAVVVSRREAYQLLRHGFLFLVKRDEVYVSGGLCYIEDGFLRFKEMGVLNGDKQLMREGAVGAMNYLRICWAHKQRLRGVNFGECWPFLSGPFQAKRKWGTTVSIPAHEHKRIWIRIQRHTPAVAQFLEANPCVIIDKKGNLHGLIATSDHPNVTDRMITQWHKLYKTPGLESLLICPSADLANNSTGL